MSGWCLTLTKPHLSLVRSRVCSLCSHASSATSWTRCLALPRYLRKASTKLKKRLVAPRLRCRVKNLAVMQETGRRACP